MCINAFETIGIGIHRNCISQSNESIYLESEHRGVDCQMCLFVNIELEYWESFCQMGMFACIKLKYIGTQWWNKHVCLHGIGIHKSYLMEQPYLFAWTWNTWKVIH